jgi:Flp pilus assembly protein TadD
MLVVCRELNDARGVVADCDEAAALGAAGATLFATRAVAYEQLGRFAEALADVNRVAALTPSDKVKCLLQRIHTA